jgi:hypothetical protein
VLTMLTSCQCKNEKQSKRCSCFHSRNLKINKRIVLKHSKKQLP